MDRAYFIVLGQVSSFSALIPLIFSLFHFKRFDATQQKIVYLLIAMSGAELMSNLLWLAAINNNPVYHIYAVVEFFILLKIFQPPLEVYLTRIGFTVLLIGFVCFAVVNAYFFQNPDTFNSNVTLVSSFIFILFVLLYLFKLINGQHVDSLVKNPLFWVSMGVLIYYATNAVLFFINQYPALQNTYRYTIWGMHAVVNLILVLFYFIALWVQTEKQ